MPRWALKGAQERFCRSIFGHHGADPPPPLHHGDSTFFAVRLLILHCTARETDGGTIDRVIDHFAPFEGLVLRRIETDRSSCSIGGLTAFDNGAAQSPSERPFGHLARQGSQKFDIWSVRILFGSP